MTLQMKVIAALAGLLLLVGSFGAGYYKGNAHEKTECKLEAATSELRGEQRKDEIAKDVRKLTKPERDTARAKWMRD